MPREILFSLAAAIAVVLAIVVVNEWDIWYAEIRRRRKDRARKGYLR